MLPSFLTRPIRRLRADGVLETLPVRAPALGAPVVLLARSRCRFERFRAPASLSRNAASAAARLHARTRAPYPDAATVLTRRGAEFGLWWWDRAAAEADLALAGADGAVRMLPEAVAQTAGEGWRILRIDGGFEAQRWAQGLVTDSAWRRTTFDARGWADLLRLHPEDAKGGAPPPVQTLPLTWSSDYRRRLVRETDWRAMAPALALTVLIAALAGAGFFLGRGVAASRSDGVVQAELTRRAAAPTHSLRPELAARQQRLELLARRVDAPGPLVRLAEVQRILARYGLKVASFDAQTGSISVTVAASAVAGVDLLVEDLQASGAFRDVRPTLDRETRRLTLRMTVASEASPQLSRR